MSSEDQMYTSTLQRRDEFDLGIATLFSVTVTAAQNPWTANRSVPSIARFTDNCAQGTTFPPLQQLAYARLTVRVPISSVLGSLYHGSELGDYQYLDQFSTTAQ
jgi:hypothetical protein